MDRVQATMAVVEGYAEHVMDEVGERRYPISRACASAMQRRSAVARRPSASSRSCSGST